MIIVEPVGRSYKGGFKVRGHAEYAERGRDIVCASVSTLTQTIANELESKRIGTNVVADGFLQCDVWIDEGNYASNIIEMMLRSLREIAHQYPQYVKVM